MSGQIEGLGASKIETTHVKGTKFLEALAIFDYFTTPDRKSQCFRLPKFWQKEESVATLSDLGQKKCQRDAQEGSKIMRLCLLIGENAVAVRTRKEVQRESKKLRKAAHIVGRSSSRCQSACALLFSQVDSSHFITSLPSRAFLLLFCIVFP